MVFSFIFSESCIVSVCLFQSQAATSPLSPSRGKSVSKFPALESITETNPDQSHGAIPTSQSQADASNGQSRVDESQSDIPIVSVTEPSFDLAEEADEQAMIDYMTQLSHGSDELNTNDQSDNNNVTNDKSPLPIRRTSSDGTPTSPNKEFGNYDWDKKKGRKAQSEKVRKCRKTVSTEETGSEKLRHKSEENLCQVNNKHEHNNNNEKIEEQTETEKPKSSGMLRKMSKKIKKTFLSKSEIEGTPLSPVTPTEDVESSPEQPEQVEDDAASAASGGFMKKMSKKVRHSLHIEDQPDRTRCHALDDKFYMIDLTSDDLNEEPVTRRLTYVTHALFGKIGFILLHFSYRCLLYAWRNSFFIIVF